MTPQEHAELEYWRGLIQQIGPEYYHAYRAAEYFEKTRYLPSWLAQTGHGVDVGCGCISVFELSSKNLFAIDPLMGHYFDLLSELDVFEGEDLPEARLNKTHETLDHGALSADFTNYYDFVICLNVIDHTHEPAALLADIHLCLVPGGKLYFEVNFEASLYAPHYRLWNVDLVDRHLDTHTGFKRDHVHFQEVSEHRQTRYWAEYTRV